MATFTTRYSIGDVVYGASTLTTRKKHPCPDCLDTREWEAKSPAGREYKFGCPRCNTQFHANHDLCIDYTAFVGSAQKLTIGQVRVKAGGEPEETEYMCRETGIGSGTLHRESKLFPTEEEAMVAATAMANAANISVEWVAKQYDQSFDISDYQLSDASVKNMQDKLKSALNRLAYIIEDIRGCISMDEVQREIDKFDEIRKEAA